MRSATMALALAEFGHQVFVLPDEIPTYVAGRLQHRNIALFEASSDGSFASVMRLEPDVVVVDGYEFGPLVRRVAETKTSVVVVDDNGDLSGAGASIIINPNLHAHAVDYRDDENRGARLLLGPQFALLRPEVVSLRAHRPGRAPVGLLLALGGTDPAGLTLPVLERLAAVRSSPIGPVRVAIPHGHPDEDEIVSIVLNSEDVARADSDLTGAFASVGLAVIGGGSTLWELAMLGIPAVAAIVADNQLAGSQAAVQAGFTVSVDARSSVTNLSSAAEQLVERALGLAASLKQRQQMSVAGRGCFDGRGASRVSREIESLIT